jgi:tricarballylate dehydrogenase
MNRNEQGYDVIIVGAGNAALTAALAANEYDVKVTVLEKAPFELRGGNTRFSGGLMRFAYSGEKDVMELMPNSTSKELSKLDIGTYSIEDFYNSVMRVTHGEADPELTRICAEQSLDTMKWMSKYGIEWDFTSLFSISDGDRTRFTPGSLLQAKGRGIGLSENLFKAVKTREIPVLYDTKFLNLLLDHNGAVCGAKVQDKDGIRQIKAKAVILASGGFEANPEMRAKYLGGMWDRVKVRGTKYDTGEGLQAALDIGAKPVGHWSGCHATPIDADAPSVGELNHTDETNRLSYLYGIMVNIYGKRFVDEGEDYGQYTYAKTGAAILNQPMSRAYQIFDQKTLGLLEKRYKTGIPIIAETIEELAVKIGVPPKSLKKTIEEFNRTINTNEFNPAIMDGKGTSDIEPPKSNWALPINTPPYVSYGVTCGITFTFGGLGINAQAQVLNTEDNPIKGLYATGEITGKFFYHNYAAGNGLMRGAVFGRLAGIAAASEVNELRSGK